MLGISSTSSSSFISIILELISIRLQPNHAYSLKLTTSPLSISIYLLHLTSRCADELNFPTLSTARTSGYQTLYRGLSNPDLYVWGQSGNGRLGIHPSQISSNYARLFNHGIPFPWKLNLKSNQNNNNLQENTSQDWGVPVKMVAGGWSFHTLTSKGKVIFWGTMSESLAFRGNDFGSLLFDFDFDFDSLISIHLLHSSLLLSRTRWRGFLPVKNTKSTSCKSTG